MPKYRHIFQNSECVPYQEMPWNIWKAETKLLEKYAVKALVAVVDKCLKLSLNAN